MFCELISGKCTSGPIKHETLSDHSIKYSCSMHFGKQCIMNSDVNASNSGKPPHSISFSEEEIRHRKRLAV